MRKLILTLVLLLMTTLVYGQNVDRPLAVGVAISADPNVHQAVYNVLKVKGISCDGLETRKDGIVTIIGASSIEPIITIAEIQVEITKIEQAQGIEVKIQKRIRALAIKNLKTNGEISADYIDVIR